TGRGHTSTTEDRRLRIEDSRDRSGQIQGRLSVTAGEPEQRTKLSSDDYIAAVIGAGSAIRRDEPFAGVDRSHPGRPRSLSVGPALIDECKCFAPTYPRPCCRSTIEPLRRSGRPSRALRPPRWPAPGWRGSPRARPARARAARRFAAAVYFLAACP